LVNLVKVVGNAARQLPTETDRVWSVRNLIVGCYSPTSVALLFVPFSRYGNLCGDSLLVVRLAALVATPQETWQTLKELFVIFINTRHRNVRDNQYADKCGYQEEK
jgi:hypothetical protein